MSDSEPYDDYGTDDRHYRPVRGRAGPTNDAATASVVIGLIANVTFFVCVSPFIFGPLAAALGGLGYYRSLSLGVGRVVSLVGIALGVAAVILGLIAEFVMPLLRS